MKTEIMLEVARIEEDGSTIYDFVSNAIYGYELVVKEILSEYDLILQVDFSNGSLEIETTYELERMDDYLYALVDMRDFVFYLSESLNKLSSAYHMAKSKHKHEAYARIFWNIVPNTATPFLQIEAEGNITVPVMREIISKAGLGNWDETTTKTDVGITTTLSPVQAVEVQKG